MSDEQRKNLLVRNKTDHYPRYTYAGDGWIDGRGVTEDGRIWNDSGKCDFSCELAPGTYVLIAECDGPDTVFQEGLSIYNASGNIRRANFPVGGAGAIPPVRLTVTDKDAGTWYVTGKRRGARWRAALFAGTEPAAWAPYSGETLAGGVLS